MENLHTRAKGSRFSRKSPECKVVFTQAERRKVSAPPRRKRSISTKDACLLSEAPNTETADGGSVRRSPDQEGPNRTLGSGGLPVTRSVTRSRSQQPSLDPKVDQEA